MQRIYYFQLCAHTLEVVSRSVKAKCASGDVTERNGKQVIENQRKDNPCYEQQRTWQDCGLVFWENGDQLTVQSVGVHICVGMCPEHCPSWDLTQPSLCRAHVSN